MDALTRILRRRRRFLTYAAIGSTGVLIDLVLFFVLFNVADVNENIATMISISVAIFNNFMWNAHFNFKLTDVFIRRFLKFYCVGMTGLLLTLAIFAIFVSHLGWDPNVVKLLSLPPVVVMQYVLNKTWSFAQSANPVAVP